MRLLSAAELHALKVTELGLDPGSLDLESGEAVAGALRRAASFLCPCTAPTLVRGVVRPMRGLVQDLDAFKGLVEQTLEAMIAHGDIHEYRDIEGACGHGTAALLYAAPPSFVARESGTVLLLGVAADQLTALPEDLEARIEYSNHLRRLTPGPNQDLRSELRQIGLAEIPYTRWLRSPPLEHFAQHVTRLDKLLDDAQPSHDVPGLSLLEPSCSVQYYRGRWVEPRAQSGRFVARRKQAYGADLWCYVAMRDGIPERLIDFPTASSKWRGCDEAWHLQMAIDAKRGEPQRFRVRPGPKGSRLVEFFSPVPMWARRRWDTAGEPVMTSGSLFGYRLNDAELVEELRFVHDTLWLVEMRLTTGSN